MTTPYSDRLRDLDDLLGVARKSMGDSEREQWAAKREALKQAAAAHKVRWSDTLSVLTRLVISTSANTGTTDQSLSQLETKCGLGRKTVQRALDALKAAQLCADEKRGGGPVNRKQGRQAPQATVRRLLFLVPLDQRATEDTAPVDSELTEDTERNNSGHLSNNSGHSGVLYYRSSTEPPYPTKAAAVGNGAAGSRSGGGKEKQKEGNGSWCEQVAWNVAAGVFDHEKEQGQADRVRNPDAVIRKHKLEPAQAWVQQLMGRSDSHKLQLLPATNRDLIAWGVSAVLGEQSWRAGDAVNLANQLWDEQQATRPAMGAAG